MDDPVILIPGLMGDARLWSHQICALSVHRPVMVALPDGATVEEISARLLPRLPARFVPVGLGLGGDVALDLLRRAPDRVARIALLSTDPLTEAAPVAAARELRMVAARAGRLMQALAEDYPTADMGPRRPAVQALLVQMAEDLGEGVYLRQSKALQRRPDQQKTMRRALLPALILGGAQDSQIPRRRHEFVAGLMPQARLHMIEGAGALLPVEAPEMITAALEHFLRGRGAEG